MKIRCLRVSASSDEQKRNAWLTVGKEYLVLGVHGEAGQLKYRLVGDDPIPIIQDAELFEVVSPEIPSGWAFRVYVTFKDWALEPAAWSVPGFWEAYFDGDSSAKRIFEQELSKLKQEQNK